VEGAHVIQKGRGGDRSHQPSLLTQLCAADGYGGRHAMPRAAGSWAGTALMPPATPYKLAPMAVRNLIPSKSATLSRGAKVHSCHGGRVRTLDLTPRAASLRR